MKKTVLLILIILLSLGALIGAPLTIVHISDIHYLAPSLYDYERLRNLSMEGDGKATHITEQAMERFVEEMLLLSPDAVVVTGDLTYNGEVKSHRELKELFSPLEEKGTKVFVLMGNHDTGRKPYALLSDSVIETEGISPMDAEELWMEFGYGEAVSKDNYSNSYLASISDDIWLLALDSNNGSGGSVRKKTLEWMENALKLAEAKGKKVISATHQNIFVHNPRYTFGYLINNSSQVISLYKKYGVSLSLSGHLHIQHIKEEDSIVEIAAEAFSDWPLQYGIIRIDDDYSYTYSTKELDDESLKDEALLTFDSSTENKFSPSLADENYERMVETAKTLNREYFRGYVEIIDEEALEMWRKLDDKKVSRYLTEIASDTKDHRTYSGILK